MVFRRHRDTFELSFQKSNVALVFSRPDFFNISAGWKGMSKWANHFVSWIVGLRGGRLDESCQGHFDEGSNCGNVSFLFFFFCRAPFVVPVFARDSGIDGNVVQPDARFYLLW